MRKYTSDDLKGMVGEYAVIVDVDFSGYIRHEGGRDFSVAANRDCRETVRDGQLLAINCWFGEVSL